jgi:polysaccharide biosynthesis transport protein
MSETTKLAQRIPDLPVPELDSSSANTNIMTTVFRRWPLILLGFILGAIAGFAWYLTSEPVYQSTAQILIIKRDLGLLMESSRLSYLEDYVSTQQQLIKSKKVMKATAEKLKDLNLQRKLPEDTNVRAEILMQNIGSTRERDAATGSIGTNILNLSMRAYESSDSRRILDQVILAYQEELKTVYDKQTEDDIKTLNVFIDRQKKDQEIRDKSILEFNKQIINKINESPEDFTARLGRKQQQLDSEDSMLKRIQSSITLMKTAPDNADVRRGIAQNIMSQLRQQLGNFSFEESQNFTPTQSSLLVFKIELEKQKIRFGKQHPAVQDLTAKIEGLEKALNLEGKGITPGGSSTFEALLSKLEHEELEKKREVSTLKGQTDSMGALRREMSGILAELKGLEADKINAQLETQRTKEKLGKLESTKNQGGYQANPISEPSDGIKVAPRLLQSLIICCFLGLMAGLLLAFAFEMTDKSFRTPAEIRRRLGLPVVGHIPPIRIDLEMDNPALKGREVNMEPVIVTHLRPKSIEAEAYRGVRTQLYFSTQGVGHQVIQVTSPNPGDGKSTLAANLAVSIAQSGKRVILVDCDFRKPRVHKIFHIEKPEVGLASVINGDCQLGEAIRISEIENLSILPCGPRPQNPAELLTSPEFQDALNALRNQYDFVIVDTPPVLAVSDPAVVAPRVDGVLLVFRMTKKARPTAERAREQLAALGANVLGVIVNGTGGTKDEGYGYGYGYNYGYGYQYQYQYEYEYADNYTDDESPSSFGEMPRPELPPSKH